MSKYYKTVEELRSDLAGLPADLQKSKDIRRAIRSQSVVLVREARRFAKSKKGSGRYFKTRQGKIKKTGIKIRDVKSKNVKRGGYTVFQNLNDTINRFPNKKNKELIYEVVGLQGSEKGGAYYAIWQLLGKQGYPDLHYSGKEFFSKVERLHKMGSFENQIRMQFDKKVDDKFVIKKGRSNIYI